MMHPRGRARLAQEEGLRLRIIHLGRRDDLQRHVDAQLLVERLVGHPHRAAAQLPGRTVGSTQDTIMRKP